ncbi:MAG: hypothetical protein KJ630_04445 [Proteobacteria bacterium]|nr:hypothetical protein [Pseudomonadota bacterium]
MAKTTFLHKIKLLHRRIKPMSPQNIVGGAGKIKQNMMLNDEYVTRIIDKFLGKQ